MAGEFLIAVRWFGAGFVLIAIAAALGHLGVRIGARWLEVVGFAVGLAGFGCALLAVIRQWVVTFKWVRANRRADRR
jgi:hypothetical protein